MVFQGEARSAHPEVPRSEKAPRRKRAMPRKFRIMVIDDDKDIRDGLSDLLEDAGYDVTRTFSARRALQLMREGVVPDVILLDLIMPDLDGWDFRAAQKDDARLAGIPVIALSAAGKLVDAAVSLRKPIRFEEVLRAVEQLRAT